MALLTGGQTFSLQKQGAAQTPGPLASTGGPPAQSGAAGGSPQDRQLAQFLMSSSWCSFSYSQTSGSTSTRRNTFQADGTLLLNSNYEGGTVNAQGGASVNIGGATPAVSPASSRAVVRRAGRWKGGNFRSISAADSSSCHYRSAGIRTVTRS